MSAQPSFATFAMDVSDRALVVRRTGGASTRSEMSFPIGRSSPLVSVGTRGDWTVTGRGVAPVHAVLAFNGTGLFACVRGNVGLSIDGVRVTSSGWVAVPAGATLALGEVRLTVVMCEESESSEPTPSSAPTRAMKSPRAKSAEVPARANAPRIQRREPRAARGALGAETSVDASFGAARVVSSSERGLLGAVTSVGGSFGTTQVVPPLERGRLGAETSVGGSFGTTQVVSPLERGRLGAETSAGGSFGTTQVVSPLERGRLGAETSAGGSFGTTQIVPPPMGRAAASAPQLPLSDAYAAAPVPPARIAKPALPPLAPLDSFGVTRMVPPEAWRLPMAARLPLPMRDALGSTRLAPPLGGRPPGSPPAFGHAHHAHHAPALAGAPDAAGSASRVVPRMHLAPGSPLGAPAPQPRGGEDAMRGGDERSAVRVLAQAHANVSPTGARSPARDLACRGRDVIAQAWRASSTPKKAMLVLLGPALLAAAFSFGGPASAKASSSRPGSSSSAASSASAAAPSNAAPTPAPSNAAPTPAASSAGPTPAPSSAGPSSTAAPAPAKASAAPAKGAPAKTAERRAIDAVASGAGEAAALEYDALAKENPDNPAFAEAARILRARAAESR
ncbi:MAG: hypothetical protein KF894_17045 [Labilithrix sp.]|nr:hypothetical protein [Labilithrix sp.]